MCSPTGNENLNKGKIPLSAVDMMPAPKLMNGMENLLLSTCSSPQLCLLCTALTISLLIKSHEPDSESDSVNQHNSLFLLSLVVLQGKIPVLPVQAPGIPVTAPGCRYNTQELCWAVEQQNWAHGLRGQPSFSQGLPARSRCWTLEWDCNYSWSKIYCGHWFCSMKYLQETSTDSLTWLKIN